MIKLNIEGIQCGFNFLWKFNFYLDCYSPDIQIKNPENLLFKSASSLFFNPDIEIQNPDNQSQNPKSKILSIRIYK